MFKKAMRFLERGELHDAERCYQAILRTDADHFGSLHYLGLVRAQQDKYDDAISLLQRALKQNPSSADTHVNLAVVFERLNRPEEAISACSAALAINGDCPEAHFTAANAHKALNRLPEAAGHFQRAIAIRPTYVEAYYNLGNIFAALQINEPALECYKRALMLRPRYPKALNNRGIVLQSESLTTEALTDFEQAIAIKPDYFEALINRGNMLIAHARPHEAYASFEQALSLVPQHSDTVYGRGIGFQGAKLVQREGDTWRYGEAIACHGKALLLRDAAVEKSTEFLEQALLRLAEAGVLAAGEKHLKPPRYPSTLYPDALRAVMRILDAAGIEAFLTGGTLLGAIRDGDFMTFDKDLDLGVRATVKRDDLCRVFADHPEFKLTVDCGEDGFMCDFYWAEKVAIDFFRFYFESDQVWCGLNVGPHVLKWLHRPFELIDHQWLGVTVKIPADSERFLTEVYGEDWRTPNPYFGLFASPNIEGGFPPISRNIAYSSIIVAVTHNELAKATELCRQVLVLDPDNELIARVYDGLKAGPMIPAGNDDLRPAGFARISDDLPA